MKRLLQSLLLATTAAACSGDPKPEDFGPPVTITPEDVIDDFEDGDDSLKSVGGRQGFWYTYKDPTPGMLTPDESAAVVPMEPGPEGMGKALKVFGGGFKEWGAGVGFQFNKMGNDAPMTYNVSAFTGVAFMAKGNVPIRVGFGVPEVLPNSEGGTCVNNAAMTNCNDLHSMVVRLTNEWRQYKIPFNRLAQQGYGMRATWDPTRVISAIFHVDVVASFEMVIDDVGLYK
jgi:hypothetical protein